MDISQSGPPASHETSQDLVEIRQEDAITVVEALTITESIPFSIGKSTLQRWAKVWSDQAKASPVKSVLVTNRDGSSYRLSRSDFEAWVIEQSQNKKPRETPEDLVRSHETSQDLARHQQISQDLMRPRDVPTRFKSELEGDQLLQRIQELEDQKKKLEEDNLHLKIDVGVRKELINRAKEEMTRIRNMTDDLLRENGALGYQIRQLAPPANKISIDAPPQQSGGQQLVPTEQQSDELDENRFVEEPSSPEPSPDQI